MNKTKYFLFSVLCMFCCSIVFAKDEIIIKSITPVYDENSNVVVKDNSVIFNDKDQSVKYNVVLENTTKEDINVTDFKLTTPTEKFIKYEIEGINVDDVIKAKGTKKVVVSLETVAMEGWGRNFNDELTALITLDSPVLNPNTSTQGIILSLVVLLIVTGAVVIILKKNKTVRYVVLIIMFSSTLTVTKALYTLNIPIKINVQYESQNVMSKSGTFEEVCESREEDGEPYEECWEEYIPTSFWEYTYAIKNIYIENELTEPQKYAYKFDVSEKKDGKVIAYLVEKKDSVCYDWDNNEISCYNLYLQADGIIYPNTNASYYFAYMFDLETINNLEGLDTSNVTDMSGMFAGTGYSSTIFNLDVSHFDTSNVTDMGYMFNETGYSNTLFTLDVSSFDTSKVTNMLAMFRKTGYSSTIFALDVSRFDTSKVTSMQQMFNETGYSSTIFTLDVSNFNTSNVTHMADMFNKTGYNSTRFNTTFTIRSNSFSPWYHRNIFYGVATKTGSQIIVNYTSANKLLIDSFISTKSSDSNVVKGVQVD